MSTTVFEESFLKQIVATNWVAVTFADLQGKLLYTNEAADTLYGYDRGELIGQSVDIFNGDNSLDTELIVNTIITDGRWSGELTQKKKNGIHFDAYLTVWLVKDDLGQPMGLASNSKDITLEKANERRMQETLKEKEVLLGEIHHRVKNNLAVVNSLLQLEELKTDNREVKDILISSQNRIKSTALVHQFLYKHDSLSKIQFKNYVEEFVQQIKGSLLSGNKIEINVTGVDFYLDINQAIPCGLIINELFTNSVKHAFNESVSHPKIEIDLSHKKNAVQIVFKDNGIGLPAEINTGKSLGMTVVKTLVKQLRGVMKTSSTSGAVFNIAFEP